MHPAGTALSFDWSINSFTMVACENFSHNFLSFLEDNQPVVTSSYNCAVASQAVNYHTNYYLQVSKNLHSSTLPLILNVSKQNSKIMLQIHTNTLVCPQ